VFTYGQPTEESFSKAKDYLCAPDTAGCLDAVIETYINEWGEDSYSAILEDACKNEDAICSIAGFNYRFGYPEPFIYDTSAVGSTCCASATVLSSYFVFEMERSHYNPFTFPHATDCIDGTDCHPSDLKPTFGSLTTAVQNMCNIAGCADFVTDILHTGGRLYDAREGDIIARNHLDMQVLCDDASTGFEICNTGAYTLLTPLLEEAELSCCEAAKNVAHTLVGQGHLYPHLESPHVINHETMAASKRVIRENPLCHDVVWGSMSAQKNIEPGKLGHTGGWGASNELVFDFLQHVDEEMFDTFLKEDMCWLPLAMENPLVGQSSTCCAAGNVFWTWMSWFKQPVIASNYFKTCPIGQEDLDVACLPDSYIPDDASFQQALEYVCANPTCADEIDARTSNLGLGSSFSLATACQAPEKYLFASGVDSCQHYEVPTGPCSPFIEQESPSKSMVFVPAGESIQSLEDGITAILLEAALVSSPCFQAQGEFLCHSRLRPCAEEGGDVRPQKVCQEDCKANAKARKTLCTAPVFNTVLEGDGSDLHCEAHLTPFHVCLPGDNERCRITKNEWDLLRGPDLQVIDDLEGEMFPTREQGGVCYAEYGTTFSMSHALNFVQCPAPFMKNTKADMDSLAKNEGVHSQLCVMPCPNFIYTEEENRLMWLFYIIPGFLAFLANFMAGSFMAVNSSKWNQTLDSNTRFLIVIALLNGLIGTMPSMVLFDQLPCGCETEDCFDTTVLCTLNRLSIPLLQTCMFALSVKIYKLHDKIVYLGGAGTSSLFAEYICAGLAFVLFVISLAIEDKTYGSKQYSLHVSRSAFLCRMRLPSFEAEFMLMHLPIMLSGVVTCFYLVRVIKIVVTNFNKVSTAQSIGVILPVPSYSSLRPVLHCPALKPLRGGFRNETVIFQNRRLTLLAIIF
jgi:hypothetical protein